MSVQKKWILLYTVILTGVSFLLGIRCYGIAKDMVVESRKSDIVQTVNQVDIDLTFWTQQISRFTDQAVEGRVLGIELSGEWDPEMVDTYLSELGEISTSLHNLLIFNQDATLTYQYDGRKDHDLDQERVDEYFQMFLENEQGERWVGVHESLLTDERVVTILRGIRNQETNTVEGMLVLELETSIVSRLILKPNDLQSRYYMGIIDAQGMLICANRSIPDQVIKIADESLYNGNRMFTVEWEGKKYCVYGQYNGMTKWKTYYAIAMDDIFPDATYLRQSITFWSRIILVLAVVLMIMFSRQFYAPFQRLLVAMNGVHGHMNYEKIEHHRKDEFGQLFDAFNFMLDRTQKLIRDVYEVQLQQKTAELKALQTEINPHFLYNALDTINWMVVEKDMEGVSDMVCSLADILRYSIEGEEALVNLQDEMSRVESYLLIQKIRMEDRLEYEVDMDDDTRYQRVPKLIMQPIVENAIKHGIEPIRSGGLVRVRSYMEGSTLVVVVQDSGIGIDSAILETINSDMQSQQTGTHIGVRNVQRRLQLYYGRGGKMQIESQYEVGTRVTLRMDQTQIETEKEGQIKGQEYENNSN